MPEIVLLIKENNTYRMLRWLPGSVAELKLVEAEPENHWTAVVKGYATTDLVPNGATICEELFDG